MKHFYLFETHQYRSICMEMNSVLMTIVVLMTINEHWREAQHRRPNATSRNRNKRKSRTFPSLLWISFLFFLCGISVEQRLQSRTKPWIMCTKCVFKNFIIDNIRRQFSSINFIVFNDFICVWCGLWFVGFCSRAHSYMPYLFFGCLLYDYHYYYYYYYSSFWML